MIYFFFDQSIFNYSSFCDATTATLFIKIGLASGSVSAGIIGANKWHYEIVGDAFDTAFELEQKASPGYILLSEKTAQLVETTYASEKVDNSCRRLISTARVLSNIPNGLLFQSPRRISLSTVPQAINRLLIASSVNPITNNNKNDMLSLSFNSSEKTLLQGRRKRQA